MSEKKSIPVFIADLKAGGHPVCPECGGLCEVYGTPKDECGDDLTCPYHNNFTIRECEKAIDGKPCPKMAFRYTPLDIHKLMQMSKDESEWEMEKLRKLVEKQRKLIALHVEGRKKFQQEINSLLTLQTTTPPDLRSARRAVLCHLECLKQLLTMSSDDDARLPLSVRIDDFLHITLKQWEKKEEKRNGWLQSMLEVITFARMGSK